MPRPSIRGTTSEFPTVEPIRRRFRYTKCFAGNTLSYEKETHLDSMLEKRRQTLELLEPGLPEVQNQDGKGETQDRIVPLQTVQPGQPS